MLDVIEVIETRAFKKLKLPIMKKHVINSYWQENALM